MDLTRRFQIEYRQDGALGQRSQVYCVIVSVGNWDFFLGGGDIIEVGKMRSKMREARPRWLGHVLRRVETYRHTANL